MTKEKGITLISLIITVIVLLILSAISIKLVISDNGVIKNAQKSIIENRGAAVQEVRDLWDAEKGAKKLLKGNMKVRGLEEVIKELEDRELLLLGEADTIREAKEIKIGNRIIVFSEIDYEEKEKETQSGDWSEVYTSTEKDNYTDKNGMTATIPKDFQVSQISGEDTIDEGLVIRGPDGSEFVWIPVPDINEMYDKDNNAGQLYSFTPNKKSTKVEYPGLNTGKREPDVVKESVYDGKTINLVTAGMESGSTVEQFRIQLQEEFNVMKDKVSIYGGFYIGRYETGDLSESVVVSKKNNTDINNQSWYVMYKKQKEMYSSSTSVESSMIWGCQWDAMLIWMNTYANTGDYVVKSTGKGNYKDTELEYFDFETSSLKLKPSGTSLIIPTGSSEKTKVKNIYDISGNMNDWTMEALSTASRITRGGSYTGKGSDKSASYRSFSYPTEKEIYTGSRMQLYIK